MGKTNYLGFIPKESGKKIFISYGRNDVKIIKPYVNQLHKMDIQFWYDSAIEYDMEWEQVIYDQMKKSEAVIFFITNDVISRADTWVKKEYEKACELNKPKLVVFVNQIDNIAYDNRDWLSELEKRQSIDAKKLTIDDVVQEAYNWSTRILNLPKSFQSKLNEQKNKKKKVFISYSQQDKRTFDELQSILEKNNIAIWNDNSISYMDNFEEKINSAIKECDIFLPIISESSQNSENVRFELDFAVKCLKKICPIRIDNAKLNPTFMFYLTNLPILDATNGVESISESLVKTILGPTPFASAEEIDSTLPEILSFFDLIEKDSSKEIDIETFRKESDITKSLAVPIGKNEFDETIYLDLHHKFDGHNCLVAGPSRSGKSRFLITYIISAMLHYSKEEIKFTIIDNGSGKLYNAVDYKNYFQNCILQITYDKLIEFLKSIDEEMHHRKQLLEEYFVSNIYQYLKIRKQSDYSIPEMPHIILIIDEFAEFKMEYPELWFEFINKLTLFGETLGFHMILCTQKIHSIVDDSLEQIITCKICSSMQKGADEHPIPSNRRIPGRLFFQSQAQDSVQLIQIAYSNVLIKPKLKNDEELNDFYWIFRTKTELESLLSLIKRYDLD